MTQLKIEIIESNSNNINSLGRKSHKHSEDLSLSINASPKPKNKKKKKGSSPSIIRKVSKNNKHEGIYPDSKINELFSYGNNKIKVYCNFQTVKYLYQQQFGNQKNDHSIMLEKKLMTNQNRKTSYFGRQTYIQDQSQLNADDSIQQPQYIDSERRVSTNMFKEVN